MQQSVYERIPQGSRMADWSKDAGEAVDIPLQRKFHLFEHKKSKKRIYFEQESPKVRRITRFISRIYKFHKKVKYMWSFSYRELLGNYKADIVKFFNRLRYYFDDLSYCWKYEEGVKNNRPHFHILINKYVPIEKMRQLWNKGYIWGKKIYSKDHLFNYLTKYFSKRIDYHHWTGGREWSSSRDMFEEKSYYCRECDKRFDRQYIKNRNRMMKKRNRFNLIDRCPKCRDKLRLVTKRISLWKYVDLIFEQDLERCVIQYNKKLFRRSILFYLRNPDISIIKN